jgi:hypothetical protein
LFSESSKLFLFAAPNRWIERPAATVALSIDAGQSPLLEERPRSSCSIACRKFRHPPVDADQPGLELLIEPLGILAGPALWANTIRPAPAVGSDLLHHIFQTPTRPAYSSQVRWVGRDSLAGIDEADFRINAPIPIQNDTFAFGQGLAPLPINPRCRKTNMRPPALN